MSFNIDRLGYYKTRNGRILKVVHISSEYLSNYNTNLCGSVIAVDELKKEFLFYGVSGLPTSDHLGSGMYIDEYLGDTPILIVNSTGYYKNKLGNTIRVIHVCESQIDYPVFIVDEGTGKFYTATLYGKAKDFSDLDLVEFISK